MKSLKKIFGKEYVKVKLSLLWLFVVLNYIYADIMSLMDCKALVVTIRHIAFYN